MSNSLISKFSSAPDIHQNSRYALAMKDNNWIILGKPGNYLFLKKVGPLRVAKIQHSNSVDLIWLKKMRKKYFILITYIEPGLLQTKIERLGLKVEPFANSATSLIDLTLSENELLKSFKSKTRYNIGYTKRKNKLKIITKDFNDLTTDDIQIFRTASKKWAERKKINYYEESFFNSLFKRFANSGWIHFAYYQDKCVGTLMILKNEKTAIYYAAFTDLKGYTLFAPTLLTWTAMVTAKKDGCDIFDFGGIYDPRYRIYRKWKGFTKFKEGFSPTVIYYPPTKVLIGW